MMSILKRTGIAVVVFGLLSGGIVVTRADLIVNGGFETGDFTGWNLSGDTGFTGVTGGLPYSPNSGNYYAFFGPFDTEFVSQDLATTPGASYNVNFWFICDGLQPNAFSFDWGGTTYINQMLGDTNGWVEFSGMLPAFSSITPIVFSFSDAQSYIGLDDASVTQASVPEPSSLALAVLGCLILMAGVADKVSDNCEQTDTN